MESFVIKSYLYDFYGELLMEHQHRIYDGTTRLVRLKSLDAVSRIMDMAPVLITKISDRISGDGETEIKE